METTRKAKFATKKNALRKLKTLRNIGMLKIAKAEVLTSVSKYFGKLSIAYLVSWPNDPKDCKFFEFRDIRGRKLTRTECLAILDRSANRLYPLNTKECLEKNFYLKSGRKLSNSECIEIVDKREMFVIKSARTIVTRGKICKGRIGRFNRHFRSRI